MEIWFAVAGVLFFISVFLCGIEIPFFESWGGDLWPLVLGILCGLGGWILFWRLAVATPPTWIILAAVLAPLAPAMAVASWRLWDEHDRLAPVLVGILPCVAVAFWASRTQFAGGAGVALLVPSVAVIAGTAWYLKDWNDPRWQIGLSDFANLAASAGAMGDVMSKAGVSSAQDESTALFIQRAGAIIRKNHKKETSFPAPLVAGATVLSLLLWKLSPQAGWVGLAAAPIAFIAPVIFWFRARKMHGFRMAVLGSQGMVYEAIGASSLVFLAGQALWVLAAFGVLGR